MKGIAGAIASVIEDLVRDRKLRWMVSIPSAIATVLVIFGFFAQLSDLVNVTLLCTAIFLGGVVLIMAVARRYMRRQALQKNKIVDRYGDAIFRAQQSNPDYFTIARWDEQQAIGRKGDTTIIREIVIRAGSNPVPAVWTRASRSSNQGLSASLREKIKVQARHVNDDGTDGTSLVVTFDWETDKGIRIFVFFDHDLAASDSVRIRLTIKWPRYASDLLDGESSKEYWLFHRSIDELQTVLTYSRSFARDGIRVTALPGSPTPQQAKGKADGVSAVTLSVSDVVPNQQYGYYVDLV